MELLIRRQVTLFCAVSMTVLACMCLACLVNVYRMFCQELNNCRKFKDICIFSFSAVQVSIYSVECVNERQNWQDGKSSTFSYFWDFS